MFDTQITVFRSARMVTVFQKIAGICYSSCTKINSHHHICICFFQPFGKFIQTNFILFKTSPCKFQTNRTFLYRSHTIFPEKVRYKVSARITYDRHVQLFYQINDILTESVSIGKWMSWLINSIVYSSSQMFNKGTINSFVDLGNGKCFVHYHFCLFRHNVF